MFPIKPLSVLALAAVCALTMSACSTPAPTDEGSYTLGGRPQKLDVAGEMEVEAGSHHFSGSVGVYTGYSSTDFRDARRASTYR